MKPVLIPKRGEVDIKQKILHVIGNLTYGGAQRLLTDMLPIFKEYGFEADLVILNKHSRQFEKELEGESIQIYDTGLNNEYSPLQAIRLARLMKKTQGQYSLVHSHLLPAQYWTVLAKKLSGLDLPMVTTEHNTYNKRRGKIYFKLPEQFIYGNYSSVICISEPAETNLLQWLPILKGKTVVIPNGINLKRFQKADGYSPVSSELPVEKSDLVILMIASLSMQKDHRTVIRSAALLPENYRFLFVGEGSQQESLVKMVLKYGLQEKVLFLGGRSDIERIIKSANLFVLSSHWEGFGLVAVEAMAGGLPVIASNVPGLAEIVKDAGMLFEAGDEKQLAENIKEILSNEELARRLVAAGTKRAEEYALEKTAAAYSSIYESLLQLSG